MPHYTYELLCIWRAPFTTCTLLNIGAALEAFASCISPTGSTVYGCARIYNSAIGQAVWRGCKWNTDTLAMTVLDHSAVPDTDHINVFAASDDGSIIYGCHCGTVPYYNSAASGPFIRWTGGGTASAIVPLPVVTGGEDLQLSWESATQCPWGVCSGDGSVMAAWVGSGASYGAYKWVNNVPVALASGPIGNYNVTGSVSANGGVVFGAGNGVPARWIGTPRQALAQTISGGWSGGFAFYGPNSDASAYWSMTASNATGRAHAIYWSNPTTGAGVEHLMDNIPTWPGDFSRPRVSWLAYDPGALVAVGSCPFGIYNTHPFGEQACKWTGTTITALGYLSVGTGAQWSQATGCSHDGSIVCGYSRLDGSVPLWWDATNTMRELPTLSDPGISFWQGEALGVSRNGAVIYGRTDLDEPPPPETLRLAMDDVICSIYPAQTTNLVSLRWSDDRGHAWGSPVTQDIGEAGEYRTSLQWQRLGMARDRNFEVSWSVPMGTALQGCWIDVTPAGS